MIVINADAKAAHQSVIDVMQAAQSAGYPHISFATQTPAEGVMALSETLPRLWYRRGLALPAPPAASFFLAVRRPLGLAPSRLSLWIPARRAAAGPGDRRWQPDRRWCRKDAADAVAGRRTAGEGAGGPELSAAAMVVIIPQLQSWSMPRARRWCSVTSRS